MEANIENKMADGFIAAESLLLSLKFKNYASEGAMKVMRIAAYCENQTVGIGSENCLVPIR